MVSNVRKWVKKWFFKGPYKVKPLFYFFDSRYRKGIHEPEGQLQIIKKEQGELFWYKSPVFLYNDSITNVKIGSTDRYLKQGLFVEPPRKLYSLHYAGTIGSAGVVYLPASRAIIKETAIEYENEPANSTVAKAIRTATPVHLEGLTISIIKMAAEGYYHFLLEALPKLLFCRELLAGADNVVISGSSKALISWLALAGVPAAKVRCTDGRTNYRYDQLLFTSDLVTDMQPNPWSVNLLAASFKPTTPKKPQRWLWASRSDATSRSLAWEDELLALFPKFEKIVFSQLAPQEVVDLMSECLVFSGPHGAAFSNMVFQQKNTSVIELYPEQDHFFRPVYGRLADVCGLKHIYVKHDFRSKEGISQKITDAINALSVE